ncbi:hypothetical protein Tco_0932676 [Tanacetum coccineum]
MEAIRRQPKVNLPYGMLLTRLFNHIVSNFPELSNDNYILYGRVMYPFAPHYERKTRSDHGMKRCRHSNSTSYSTAFDHSSSSHLIDDNVDEHEEETTRSNTPLPSRLVNSFSHLVPQVLKNQPQENQNLHTYQTEILNHQSQHRDEHRKGLRCRQQRERLIRVMDASLVDTKSSGTELREHDTSSRSGNDAHVDDVNIRPIYDEEPMDEVPMFADDNVSATRQQHTKQLEFNKEGEVDQNAEQCHDTRPLFDKLTDNQTIELSNQSLESENPCLKKTVS